MISDSDRFFKRTTVRLEDRINCVISTLYRALENLLPQEVDVSSISGAKKSKIDKSTLLGGRLLAKNVRLA